MGLKEWLEKRKKDREYQDELKAEAKAEAQKEAKGEIKDILKKQYKEQEIHRVTGNKGKDLWGKIAKEFSDSGEGIFSNASGKVEKMLGEKKDEVDQDEKVRRMLKKK